MTTPRWLDWAKRLQAIAQNGLTFAQDPFDIERYEAIRQIAAEIMADKSDKSAAQIVDLFSQEVGYATPKVDVRAAIFRDDAILFVRERSEGLWTLPGGWADVSESPAESIAKEVYEESGYEVKVSKLLAVYDRAKHPHEPLLPHHIYKLFFLCEIIGGQISHSTEIDGVDFFKEDQIPPLSLTRITPAQITRMFEHYRHPDRPADFD